MGEITLECGLDFTLEDINIIHDQIFHERNRYLYHLQTVPLLPNFTMVCIRH